MPAWKQRLLIGGLALLLYTAALGQAPLWDRDEPRNAGCAAEMMARRDWVVPVFNDELRTHKPVLLYWLMMTSYRCFGIHEFSARLPSALLGVGTIWLTFGIARRLANEQTARWASIVLATSLLFTMSSRAATPDATLVFFTTLAMWSCVCLGADAPDLARQERGSIRTLRLNAWSTIGVYGAMGLAVLAKGPVGVVLPAAALAGYAWTRAGCPRSPSRLVEIVLALKPLIAVILLAIVAGPWYSWVGLRTDGAWLVEFFGQHNLTRAMQPMEGHSGSGWLYYPVSLLVGFFPWSVLAVPIGLELFREVRTSKRLTPLQCLASSWLAVYLAAFSIAQTKLPSYLLPAYPAVAILVGSFLDRWLADRRHIGDHWFAIAFGSLILSGLAFTAGLVWAIPQYLYRDWTLLTIGVVPWLGGVCTLTAWKWHAPHRQLGYLAGTAIAINLAAFAWGTTRVGRHQECFRLLAPIQDKQQSPVAAFGTLEPSWVFYARRPIRFFSIREPDALAAFLESHPSAYVIVSADDRARLPSGLDRAPALVETPYFMRQGRVQMLRTPITIARR